MRHFKSEFDLLSSTDSPHELTREAHSISGVIITGPHLNIWLRDESTGVHAISKTLHHLPPWRFVGHGKIITLVAIWNRLLSTDLLQESNVDRR